MKIFFYLFFKSINVAMTLVLAIFLNIYFSQQEAGLFISAIAFLFLLIVLYNEGFPVTVIRLKDKIENSYEITQFIFSRTKIYQYILSIVSFVLLLWALNISIKYSVLALFLPIFFITKVTSSFFKTKGKLIFSALLDSGLQNVIILLLILYINNSVSVLSLSLPIFILCAFLLLFYVLNRNQEKSAYVFFENTTIIKNNLLGYFYINGYPIFMILFAKSEEIALFRLEERIFAIFSASFLFFQPVLISYLHKNFSIIKARYIILLSAIVLGFSFFFLFWSFQDLFLTIPLTTTFIFLATYSFLRFVSQLEISINEVLGFYRLNLKSQVMFVINLIILNPILYIFIGYNGISLSFLISGLISYIYLFLNRKSTYTVY